MTIPRAFALESAAVHTHPHFYDIFQPPLKPSRPVPGAAQAVGRHKKAPPGGDSSGAIMVWIWGWPFRTACEFQPSRSVTQADSAQERPQREAGAVEQASFYPRGKPKENYKGQNWPLKDIASANGVATGLLKYAKAVWDAAETSNGTRKAPTEAGASCHTITGRKPMIG